MMMMLMLMLMRLLLLLRRGGGKETREIRRLRCISAVHVRACNISGRSGRELLIAPIAMFLRRASWGSC